MINTVLDHGKESDKRKLKSGVYFDLIAENVDAEVQLKLFDQNGDLVLQTLHDTHRGNSYTMPPDADTTGYQPILIIHSLSQQQQFLRLPVRSCLKSVEIYSARHL